MKTTHCPKCKTSLQGDPIPEKSRDIFGGETHFGRVIGMNVLGVWDGVAFWRCPDCGYQWHRFTPDDLRHVRLEALRGLQGLGYIGPAPSP